MASGGSGEITPLVRVTVAGEFKGERENATVLPLNQEARCAVDGVFKSKSVERKGVETVSSASI